MKYLNSPAEISGEFRRLMRVYDEYYWMVAWAGKSFPQSEDLLANVHKIRRMVVGLHYFHTHPSFIKTFNPFGPVRFIKTSTRIFLHSKVYLFVNSDHCWEALVGSVNFTNAALHSNNEAALLIDSGNDAPGLLKQLKTSIESVWRIGTKFTTAELEDYKALAAKRPNPDIPDETTGNAGEIAEFVAPGVAMNWQQYIDRMLESGGGKIRERIALLNLVQVYFREYPVFSDMPPLLRKQVCGFVYARQPADFRLFGNMQNATAFTHQVNTDPSGISAALDAIPLEGPVSAGQFETFRHRFERALDGGNKYRSATRLLAMKRPDLFFAISLGNNLQLAAHFDIRSITTIDLTRYWHEVVMKIHSSTWWRDPQPVNDTERSISNYRAAFLDTMYYKPSVY